MESSLPRGTGSTSVISDRRVRRQVIRQETGARLVGFGQHPQPPRAVRRSPARALTR
ncbi:hypothetical protein SLI_6918 [Streptomyces lividans 1326]|uniref:Uncharacterized protein n=1 Tax=Streptomyces lividans 1326 TaxID=1200984 RepID=A0A7U9E2F9_STRLI|nr:hypothetical protein SLI_6918 [Streptomyces lividans 1326]